VISVERTTLTGAGAAQYVLNAAGKRVVLAKSVKHAASPLLMDGQNAKTAVEIYHGIVEIHRVYARNVTWVRKQPVGILL
jgi:hypothetical protein